MYILSTLFQCGGIRIKVDLPFLLKKKWTRAKRDGSLSDPINHAKSSAAVFFHWHVCIHLEIITFGTDTDHLGIHIIICFLGQVC